MFAYNRFICKAVIIYDYKLLIVIWEKPFFWTLIFTSVKCEMFWQNLGFDLKQIIKSYREYKNPGFKALKTLHHYVMFTKISFFSSIWWRFYTAVWKLFFFQRECKAWQWVHNLLYLIIKAHFHGNQLILLFLSVFTSLTTWWRYTVITQWNSLFQQ